MNNAKVWLVVSPTVGVPLFLSAVAVASVVVHVGIIKNTTWIESYHQGTGINAPAETAAATIDGQDLTAKASYVLPSAEAGSEISVIMPDGTVAKAILQSPDQLAAVVH